MLSTVARLILTSSAVAPVGYTYAWVAYLEGQTIPALFIAIVSTITAFVALFLFRYAHARIERSVFNITSVEAADRENIAFLMLYLMPLFTSQFGELRWDVWVPVLIIFSITTATGYNYHFNPLLWLLGWHFYKVGSKEGVTFVLITRRELKSAHGSITVGQLTEYILLDVQEKDA